MHSKLVPHPRRKTHKAVGYDVYCPKDVVIPEHSATSIDLGFCVRPPKDHFVRICSRSGMASAGVHCFEGIIDPGKTLTYASHC